MQGGGTRIGGRLSSGLVLNRINSGFMPGVLSSENRAPAP